MGPPPHLEALLLVTTTVMCTGGFASRWIAHGGEDDIDAVSKSDSSDPEGSPRSRDDEGEHANLIRHDVLLNEKKHPPKREMKDGVEAGGKQLVQRAAIERPSASD